MYPRNGAPLVPLALRPGLGARPVPVALIRRYGLPGDLRLADLDERVWIDFPPEAIRALTDAVVAAVRQSSTRGYNDALLVPTRPLPLDELALSLRSRNALVWAGLVQDGQLQPTPLGRIASAPNLGAIALLDILTEIERADSADSNALAGRQTAVGLSAPAGGLTANVAATRLAPSPAVRRAARPLVSRRWGPKILSDDPRLGVEVSALHPLAETAKHAGELLLKTAVEPSAARQKARQVREFIARADALRYIPLEEELDQIVAAIVGSGSAKEVVKTRLGFAGDEPATLEAAGRVGNVTRERARQLTKRFRDEVSRRGRVWTPALDGAVRVVADVLPATAEQVQQKLRDEGIAKRNFSLHSLMEAAEVFGIEPKFEYDRGSSTLRREGQASAGPIVAAAHKLVTHWGATTVDDVEALLEEQGTKADPALIRVIVGSIRGFAWLDAERGWFWIKGTARNRLLNQVEKVMAVAGSIALSELRDGVGRHHRMEGFRPPREVLARLCEDSGLYRREGDRIVGGANLPDWRDVLGKIERGLVEILFERGPVMRKDELVQVAVGEKGLNRNSVSVYLTYSPVLERYAPGVWGLRGAPVTAAEIQTLIPPRVRYQVLQDHGWTRDGRIWVAYRLSPAVVESGVLGTPAALRGVARGPFALFAEGGRAVGTLVIEDNIWGISSFLRRWGVEAGDYLVITLDLSERKATIAVGAEDLSLRYQHGE